MHEGEIIVMPMTVVFLTTRQFHTVFTPVGSWGAQQCEVHWERISRGKCVWGKICFLESAEGQIRSEMSSSPG